MFKHLLITGLTALFWLSTQLTGLAQQSQLKSWTSNDRQHTTQASLVDFDRQSDVVHLELEDGSPIDVKLHQLCLDDRRFITGEMRRRSRDETTPAASTVSGEPQSGEGIEETEQPRARSLPGKSLYGINWIPDMESAMVAASGKERASDDRPIMWFRVLGDLEGFM